MTRRLTLGARVVLAAVKAYQRLISPLFTGSCRYLPSCSDYMLEAVERHGAIAGVALGVGRLGRCHPFGGSGLDPVPHSHPFSKTTPEVVSVHHTPERNHSGCDFLA